MGSYTDIAQLQGMRFADFDEVFEYVEALRKITELGEEIVTMDHAFLKDKFTSHIANRWHLYERVGYSGRRHSGKLINTRLLRVGPWIEGGPSKVANEIVRPLKAAAENFSAAREAVAKFPHTFAIGMAPILVPERMLASGDDFGDRPPAGY